MCCSVPPVTDAPRTPSSFCRRGTARRSISERSSFRPVSPPLTAMKITGKSETEPAKELVWVSSGSCPDTFETARST